MEERNNEMQERTLKEKKKESQETKGKKMNDGWKEKMRCKKEHWRRKKKESQETKGKKMNDGWKEKMRCKKEHWRREKRRAKKQREKRWMTDGKKKMQERTSEGRKNERMKEKIYEQERGWMNEWMTKRLNKPSYLTNKPIKTFLKNVCKKQLDEWKIQYWWRTSNSIANLFNLIAKDSKPGTAVILLPNKWKLIVS